MPDEPIRVVVADDHPVFRDGLAMLLASVPGIEVVGRAANGAEAVVLALELHPGVLVIGPTDARAQRHRRDPAPRHGGA